MVYALVNNAEWSLPLHPVSQVCIHSTTFIKIIKNRYNIHKTFTNDCRRIDTYTVTIFENTSSTKNGWAIYKKNTICVLFGEFHITEIAFILIFFNMISAFNRRRRNWQCIHKLRLQMIADLFWHLGYAVDDFWKHW